MSSEASDPIPAAQAARELFKTLIEQGRLQQVMELAKSIRPTFPLDPILATMHAYVLYRLGRNQDAVEVATEASRLGTRDPMNALVLGGAQRRCGRHAEAAEALLIAHRLLPARVDAATMLIEATAAAHGIEAARAVYADVIDRLPDPAVIACWSKLLFDAGLDVKVSASIVSAPVMSMRAWAERAGRALDFVGPREIMRVEDPPIFDDPSRPRPRTEGEGYVPYSCSLPGATIFARSSLILMPDGTVLNDTLADERFGRFLHLPHDTMVLRRRADQVLLDVGRHAVTDLEAGIMLSGWASEHFGHWVPEYLCRLSYLKNHPRFAALPIIVDSGMPSQHLDYLRLLVSNPIVEIPAGGAFRCGELVVASPSTFFPMHLTPDHQVPTESQGGLPVGGFRFLQQRILERLPASAAPGRKLYLSRRSSSWRRLLNDDEISVALAAHGFEVLFPEEMTFEEQVRTFQSASVVVAPNGSSLLNVIFAATDVELIVLSQRSLFNWGSFYGLMRELGYDLTFFCGDAAGDEKHAHYSVPVTHLLEAIETRLHAA